MAEALSNRQRKALKKKAPAKAAPRVALVPGKPAPVEPRGLAAREAVRDQMVERLMRQKGLDLAVAVALGNMTAAQAKAEVRVEPVALSGVIVVGERGAVKGAHGLRVSGRDGLHSLVQSGTLTKAQWMAGLAYRQCYEAAAGGLKSCLGSAGGGGGVAKVRNVTDGRDPAELRRAYLMARLRNMESLVLGADPSGRSLDALRSVAGLGETVGALGGVGGNARAAWRSALVDALDIITTHLRIRAS